MSLSKTTQKEFIQNKDEFKAPIELLELINLMANKMSAQQWSLFTHKLETENELEIPALKLTPSEQEIVRAGARSGKRPKIIRR